MDKHVLLKFVGVFLSLQALHFRVTQEQVGVSPEGQ